MNKFYTKEISKPQGSTMKYFNTIPLLIFLLTSHSTYDTSSQYIPNPVKLNKQEWKIYPSIKLDYQIVEYREELTGGYFKINFRY